MTQTQDRPPQAPLADRRALALLRNDLAGLSRSEIADLVGELTERMGIDPALSPIDVLTQRERQTDGSYREKASIYINARGAAELDKLHDINDDDLEIDIRERVVIVRAVKSTPLGRRKRDVGASSFDPERPDTLAKAIKTATTSAHRRCTLRLVGVFINEPPDLASPDV